MANVSQFSTTAASNNSAAPDGAAEGVAPGDLNDIIREMMASLSKWYKDTNGSLTTTGSSNAYVLSTNNSHAALSDCSLILFKPNHANTGSATLNVDTLGAKTLKFRGGSLVGGEFGTNRLVLVAYNSSSDVFDILGGVKIPVTQTFTPTITAATAGDLSVAYSTQSGNYWKIGDVQYFQVELTFTPTFTTATGAIRVASLPNSHSVQTAWSIVTAAVSDSTITWPTNITHLVGVVQSGNAYATIRGAGSGENLTTLDIDDFTSGQAVTLRLQGSYPV